MDLIIELQTLLLMGMEIRAMVLFSFLLLEEYVEIENQY